MLQKAGQLKEDEITKYLGEKFKAKVVDKDVLLSKEVENEAANEDYSDKSLHQRTSEKGLADKFHLSIVDKDVLPSEEVSKDEANEDYSDDSLNWKSSEKGEFETQQCDIELQWTVHLH